MSSVVFTTLFSLAIALLLELAIVICVSAVDVSSPPMDFVKKKVARDGGRLRRMKRDFSIRFRMVWRRFERAAGRFRRDGGKE
jgi:hypothetical protein